MFQEGVRSICESCSNKRDVVSGKGSRFLLCERALIDAKFSKYPPQPLVSCVGFEAAVKAIRLPVRTK